ncbi:MAG: hypothetical protein ACM3SS_21365 [Rhodospirillaceae bacterium]
MAHPLDLLDGSLDVRSTAARALLARELAQEIAGALKRLAPPPPGESAGVIEELAAIERLQDSRAVNARMQRLFGSSPFQQLRLMNRLTIVHDSLDCAASAYGPVRREMACWAIAAAYLTDRLVYEEALDVLIRSGRVAYGGGMPRARWLGLPALWARYAAAIQDYITIPYLSGRLD